MKAQIQEELKVAMRAQDKLKVTTLRGLMAAIKQIEVDKRIEVDSDTVLALVQKEIKKRRDSIGFAEQAGRADLIETDKAEISILETFLGAQLSEEELKAAITKLVSEGAGNIGQIMGGLKKSYNGQFEGAIASRLAKEVLG